MSVPSSSDRRSSVEWRSGPTHLGQRQVQLTDGITQSLHVQLLEVLTTSQLLSGRPVKKGRALVVRRAVVPKRVDLCQLQLQVAPQLAVEGDAVLLSLSQCSLSSCCGKQVVTPCFDDMKVDLLFLPSLAFYLFLHF